MAQICRTSLISHGKTMIYIYNKRVSLILKVNPMFTFCVKSFSNNPSGIGALDCRCCVKYDIVWL